MARYIESGDEFESEPLLNRSGPQPSTSRERPGYEQRKRVNESHRFVFPDHGTYLGLKIPDVDEVPTMDNPITIALDKCQRFVLRPYSRLLTLVAWQPLFEQPTLTWQSFLNFMHPTLITLLILCGYVIQYASCFRRDGAGGGIPANVTNMTVLLFPDCQHFVISQYLVPDILHSAAYFYSFYVFRIIGSEQLPTLMERVFLQTSATQRGFLSQGRLIRRLRMLLWFSIIWVVLSQLSLVLHLAAEYTSDRLNFTWLEIGGSSIFGRVALMVLMGVSFVMLDIVYVSVVLNYCVQCVLLLSYVNGLLEKIHEHLLDLEQVITELGNVQDHLRFFNRHPGTAMSIVMINFGTMAITGFLAFLSPHTNNFTLLMYIATGMAITLWFTVMAVPIVLAARLTAACNTVRKVGHEIRVRPFAFQDESNATLDSFLLYTSTLRLKAKIFLIPVRSSYVCGIMVLALVTLMLLFQTGNLRVWL